ncbi:MAG TPA: hypothetical protein GX723_04275 [Thermoanaerobacterales bacterium]|nr:hypothetical protein [Thermoanaerobacterales bacterium]
MANIKDFISSSSNENIISLTYLLLMANVLGLAIFIESNPKQKKHFTKPSAETVIPVNKEDTLSDDKSIDKALEDNDLEKAESLNDSLETAKNPAIDIKPRNKDNVISFKEAMVLKSQENKPPLKPLKWNFPNKL